MKLSSNKSELKVEIGGVVSTYLVSLHTIVFSVCSSLLGLPWMLRMGVSVGAAFLLSFASVGLGKFERVRHFFSDLHIRWTLELLIFSILNFSASLLGAMCSTHFPFSFQLYLGLICWPIGVRVACFFWAQSGMVELFILFLVQLSLFPIRLTDF